MIITISPEQNNITPKVIQALEQLKSAGGGELLFEKGEYHFYKEGAWECFVAVTNNFSCDRKIIFPIIERDNITINGNGSVFVFHDITTPFYVYKSRNTVIKNIIFDRAYSPVVNMQVKEKSDTGFMLQIDKTKSPYRVENGNLIFEREWGDLSTADKKLSLHLKSEHCVQYLFAGDSIDSTQNLPASFMLTDASKVEDGVYLTYREDTQSKCIYREGAELYCLADGSSRESDVILLSDSDNVKIDNVTIRRGLSMGIIAQLCSNIEVDGFKTDRNYYNENTTLTADCMHFVNCSGILDIHDCDVEYISDDVINIHGVYTLLKEKNDNKIVVKLKHQDQRFFNPYKLGDIIDIISPQTYEVVSQFTVENSQIVSECGSLIEISGSFKNGFSNVQAGFLVENSKRMPDVNIHNNKFKHFPSMRVSGAGKIVIKDNELSHCSHALQAIDLADYWMESGRINELIFTKNTLKDCYSSFIIMGISGMKNCDAFKIHNKIEISDNKFYEIKDKVITAGGVKSLIIKDNLYDTEKEEIISVDDKIIQRS